MVVITLRAKEPQDQGTIYQYWSSQSLPQIPTSVDINNGKATFWTRQEFGLNGTPVTLNPGEKVGHQTDTSKGLEYRNTGALGEQTNSIRISNLNGLATGTVRLELYRADTKALIIVGTNVDVTTIQNSTTGDDNLAESLIGNTPYTEITGGVIVAAHFFAGGTGSLLITTTNFVGGGPKDGTLARQSTGGSWTRTSSIQPKGRVVAQLNRPENKNMFQASTMYYTLRRPYTSGTTGYTMQSYYNLKGITIPIGSTINSAVLTIRHGRVDLFGGISTMYGQIKAVDDKSFSLPQPNVTYPPGQVNPTLGYERVVHRTTGSAVPFLKTTGAGTQTLTAPFTMTEYIPTGAPPPVGGKEKTFDLQAIVQALVNKFDYNNDSMFFQLGLTPSLNGSSGSSLSMRAVMYSRLDSVKNHITNGQTGTGNEIGPGTPETTATSQGVSTYVPKLVIDFTAGAPPVDFPFTADALLFLGEYLRSCSEVDAILEQGFVTNNLLFTVDTFVSPDDPGGDFEVAEAILDYLAFNGDKTGFELLAEVINPVTGNPYKNHAIKNAIGYLERENQITGNPFVPPPSETGAYNFKKTTWTLV